MTRARLYALSGRLLGSEFLIQGEVVLGRAPAAGLRLADPSISREHARLVPEGEGFLIIDLGSSNGVFVGDRRVRDAILRDHSEFRLGALEFRLRIETGGELAQPAPAGATQETERLAAEPRAPEVFAGEEILLEGDWEDPVPSVPRPAAIEPAPLNRSATLPAPAPTPRPSPADERARTPSRPILRAQPGPTRATGLLASDLGQQGLLTRWALYLLVLALFLAVALGSWYLTRGLREARTGSAFDAEEVQQ